MKIRLFVDIQFMQTGAFGRGMGQHVRALFKSAVSTIPQEINDIYFISSSMLASDNVAKFEAELKEVRSDAPITFLQVPTKAHEIEIPGSYAQVYTENQRIVQEVYHQHALGEDIWFIPCPMQEPVVPALPDARSLRKLVLWYDLMPYLMYKHYFSEPTSPYAVSYLKRMNMLLEYDHILTISETSKNDLIRYLSLAPEDITNTQGWVNTEIDGKGMLPERVKKPFILLNASTEPNKNAERAIRAFHEFNLKHEEKYQLAVTSDYSPKLKDIVDKMNANVVFMGHIPSEDLKQAYLESKGLLFVSLYEGLGLPPLEAVNFEKKVILSDTPVHREFGGDEAFYWCNPYSETSIAKAIERAVCSGESMTEYQRAKYRSIIKKYSWDVSSNIMWKQMLMTVKNDPLPQSVAIVGPHPNSFSSIGKFIVETYPAFVKKYSHVDYYYDQGPSDRRHGSTRFNYLGASSVLRPIEKLLAKEDQYDEIIYHMGNSDHHMSTYLLAHKLPRTLVLHDTNLSGDGLSGQMLSNGYVSRERIKAEQKLEVDYLGRLERFISSLVSVQSKIITHSQYAEDVATQYIIADKNGSPKVRRLEHPLRAVSYRSVKTFVSRPLRFGIAGIVTEVKGVNILDWLLRETNGLNNAELHIFGYGFFTDKRALLDFANHYNNVHVNFDLTDMEFNNAMSKLDVLINFREVYKGEASRATLEAIRECVVPIVRNVGWFDELPDSVAFKINTIEEMPELIRRLCKGGDSVESELQQMIQSGQALLREKFSPEDYRDGIMQ